MKHLISTLTLLIAIAPVAVHAEKPVKHPVKPLLWKIEGDELKNHPTSSARSILVAAR